MKIFKNFLKVFSLGFISVFLLINQQYHINEINNEITILTKSKNIKDFDDKDMSVFNNVKNYQLLAKTKKISIIEIFLKNNDDVQYYVVNNITGDYFLQKEMTNTKLLFNINGFDEVNDAFHFTNENQNYWYLIKTNEFVKNNNNYKFDENITFKIDENGGWTHQFYLEADSSKRGFLAKQILKKETWDIGKDPKITSIHHSRRDNLFTIEGSLTKKGQIFTYSFNADQMTLTPGVFNHQVRIGYDLFYDNYFQYIFGSDGLHYYQYLYNFQVNNNSWTEAINDKYAFIDNQGNFNFLKINNYSSDDYSIYNTNIQANETKNQIMQSNDGGFYFLDKYNLKKYNFNNKKIEVLNDSTKEIFLANEEFFVTKSTDNKLIVGSKFLQYGVKILPVDNLNSFIENDIFYFDNKNFIIDIDNSNVNSITLNNKRYSSISIHHWQINLSDDDFIDENNFILELKLISRDKVSFEFKIVENYFPMLEMETINTKEKIKKHVYDDNGFDNTESIIDGLYSSSESEAWINDSMIENVFVNGVKEEQGVKYKVDNSAPFYKVKIIDKFGKENNEKIYINDKEPTKYWYDDVQGKENYIKLQKLGYLDEDIDNLNAFETRTIVPKLDDVFDLDMVDIRRPEYEETITAIGEDVKTWYGSQIPINRLTLNYNKNKKGELQEKTLKEIIKESFIKNFNHFYKEDLSLLDFDFTFSAKDKGLINFSSDTLTACGTDTNKVVGSLVFEWGFEALEAVSLLDFDDSSHFDVKYDVYLGRNINSYLNNLSDNQKNTFKFKDIKDELDQIALDTMNEYINSKDYDFYHELGFDFNNENGTVREGELQISWWEDPFSNKSPDPETLIKDIELFNIDLSGSETSFLLQEATIRNVGNPIYGFNIPDPDIPDKNSLTMLWIILGMILMMLLILVLYFLIKRNKDKKEYDSYQENEL